MSNNKLIAVAVVAIVAVAGASAFFLMKGNDENKGGFYAWNPNVLEINGAYSNSTPSLLTLMGDVYEGAYSKELSDEVTPVGDIPEEYLWPYDDYVSVDSDGSLTVRTYDSSSTGRTLPNATTIIESVSEKVVCYTAAYVDTIYNILCSYYGEEAGDSPKATERLWEIVVGVPADCKTDLESNFGIAVPDDVLIFDLGEKMLTYCEQLADECGEGENITVLMTEYNIRSTNARITEATVNTIESNTDGKIKFVFVLSNSLSMVLSNTKMIGMILGIENTQSFIDEALSDIYTIKKSIEDMDLPEKKTVYVETAAGKAAGSGNLITNLLTEILGMKNIADHLELMDSALSDEQIITAQPEVIIFYKADKRSMDERMRVTSSV